MAYVWAKHEEVNGSVYQVLTRRGGAEGDPIALGTQDSTWGEGVLRLPPGPSLGLYPYAHQVTFSEESLPKGHGDFILGYYSHHHSILIGVTEPFQVNGSDSRVKAGQDFPAKCHIIRIQTSEAHSHCVCQHGREVVGRLDPGVAPAPVSSLDLAAYLRIGQQQHRQLRHQLRGGG